VIAKVVAVDAIEHQGATGRRGDRRQTAVQLTLAGVAAVLGVAAVGGISQLRRGEFPVAHPKPAGLQTRLLQQMGREGGGDAGDG
jgi:hypothetical protein